MKKNDKILGNKGFSLVELIVTVLVTAILMLGVIAFVSTSRSAYQVVNTSATLQEESITVNRVLTELIREAKAYGFDTDESISTKVTTPEGEKTETHNVDIFWTMVMENDHNKTGADLKKDVVYFFVVDKTDNKIRYCKSNKPDEVIKKNLSEESVQAKGLTLIKNECYDSNLKYSLIADHVKSMTCSSVEKTDGTDLVCIELKFEYLGKEYTDDLSAITRNQNRPTPTYAESGSGEDT